MHPSRWRSLFRATALGAATIVAALTGLAQAPPRQDPHREWAKDAKPAGSKSCEKCHSEHYQRWQDSAHSKMVQLPTAQTVRGDFTADNILRWKGYTYRMFIRDATYFMEVAPPQGAKTTYRVDYTVGSKRVQGYMSRLADGRLYLLPAYWRVATESWFDSSLITPHTGEGVGVQQYWNTNCLACHATDLRFDFDPATKTYSTHWLELAIGCEACHNPGSKHNEFFEKKPLRDYARKEMNDTFISNQKYFDYVRSTELCASCHGTKTNYFLGYWPGDRGFDYYSPILMDFNSPDQQGDFYPDGHPTRFNHFLEFMGSRCFLDGKATCVSCHDGHSSENDSLLLVPKERSNVLCLNCHQEKYGGTKLTEHTFHLPDSPGSRCYECHMGETLERLMMHRKDHSLDNPIPENTIRYGIPNACNQARCHGDRTPEWAAKTIDEWYGEKRKKLLYASEAMWLAKVGDARAVPLLVRAVGDANLRLNMRASAAHILGSQFGERAQEAVPALVRQLSSAEPLLRIASADALGSIHDRSAAGPLTRLLTDPARVVRITAAAALINLNVLELEGDDGKALRQAKTEYVQALRTWPNVPEFRLNLASYYLLHSRFDEALSESRVALQLNPDMPGAYYVVARTCIAMQRWADALAALKKLREVKPDFPNLQRLIAATEQQVK